MNPTSGPVSPDPAQEPSFGATPAPPSMWDSTQSSVSSLGQLLPASPTVSPEELVHAQSLLAPLPIPPQVF